MESSCEKRSHEFIQKSRQDNFEGIFGPIPYLWTQTHSRRVSLNRNRFNSKKKSL